MCGRYVLFTDEAADEVTELVHEIQQKLYGGAQGPALRTNGEVFPSQWAPVLTVDGPEAMIWGLPGFNGKSVIINARAESVCEKPLFRPAMERRRVAVLSHGFYEWRRLPGSTPKKEKLLFNRGEGRALVMAGLYNPSADGPRFAIITTAANDAMQPIHSRMPVMLDTAEIADYLRDPQAAREIIRRVPPVLSYRAA